MISLEVAVVLGLPFWSGQAGIVCGCNGLICLYMSAFAEAVSWRLHALTRTSQAMRFSCTFQAESGCLGHALILVS